MSDCALSIVDASFLQVEPSGWIMAYRFADDVFVVPLFCHMGQ